MVDSEIGLRNGVSLGGRKLGGVGYGYGAISRFIKSTYANGIARDPIVADLGLQPARAGLESKHCVVEWERHHG
jgi:hypothetical protein